MATDIKVKIGLQGAEAVGTGLQRVQAGLGGLATQAGSAAAVLGRLAPQLAAVFTVGAFTQFARSTAQAIDEMNDLADATGASIEEISKLDAVVRRSGGTFDTAAGALVKFNDVLRNAKPGSAQADALRSIGLEAAALQRLDPAAALRETAVALSRFADDGEKARLVQELFGKSVREVAPLLKDLAEAGDEVATVTTKQAEEIDKLNKALARLKADAATAGRELLLELAPALSEVADRLQAARETYGSLFGALRQNIGARQFQDAAEGAKFYQDRVEQLAATVKRLETGGSLFDRINLGNRREDLQEAEKLLQFYERVLSLQGRAAVGDFGPPVAPPSIGPRADPAAAAAAERAAKAAAAAAERAAEAYARFTGEVSKSIRLQQEELANEGPLSAARRIQIDGYTRLAEVAGQLTLQQRLVLRGLIEEQAAGAALIEQQQAEARIVAKLADERDRYLESLAKSVDSSRSAADAAADELVGLLAGAQALEELRTARLEDAAAELERKAAIESGGPDGNSDAAALYRAEAAELRRLAAIRRRVATATADNKVTEANEQAAREAADAWQRTADQIGQSLTEALIEGGLSGREAIERAFKALVLRPIVDAAVQPLAQSITGGLSSLLGIGGGAGGSGGGALGALGGAAGFAGSFGTFGSLFNAGAALTGTGISGTLGALSGAGSLIGQGQIVNGLGLGAGALGPYAAAALVIAQVAKSLDKSGTPSTGSVVTADAQGQRTGGDDPSGILRNLNSQTDAALRTLAGGAVGLLNGLAQSVGQAASFTAQAKFTADNVDQSFGDFVLSRDGRTVGDIAGDQPDGARSFDRDPTKGFEAFAVDVAAITRQALEQIDLPDFARRQIEALGTDATLDELTAVGQQIQATIATIGALRTSLEPLAGSLSLLAGASSDSLVRLADLSGGFDALGANISTFYEAFVDEGERAAAETQRITTALAKFGLALPATRDEFADLVQAQIALGDAGQPALAALLGVAGAFDTLADRADELQGRLDAAISNAAGRIFQGEELRQFRVREIQVDLADAGVQIDLSTLLGATVDDIRNFAQAFVQSGTASAEAQIAVLDAAGALVELRRAADDTAAAAAAAAAQAEQQAAAELAARRASITSRLDSVAADFLSPAALQQFRARRITEILGEAGIETNVETVLASTAAAVRQLFASVGLDGQEAILEALPLWQALNDSITASSRAVDTYRRGTLGEAIEDARLATLSPQDRIARLRGTETQLFGELSTSDDPVGVAQRLTTVTLRRIREEADLRAQVNRATIDGLEEQLDSARALRDVVRGLPQFTSELRFGDLSPLSQGDQLAAAQALFDSTLVRARGGDQLALSNLQGNAQALISEAIDAFGSGPAAGAIFDRVVGALDALAAEVGPVIDPQIAALEAQVSSLESIDETAAEQLAALLSIDEALAGRLTAGDSRLQPSAEDVTALAQASGVTQPADGGAAAAQERYQAELGEIRARIEQTNAALAQVLAAIQGQTEVSREGHLQTVRKLTESVDIEGRTLSQLQFGVTAVSATN